MSDDWVAPLPREKSQLFDARVRHWESGYAMMSVALDDSLALRRGGELVCAQRHVSISSDLLLRLSAELEGACIALGECGRSLENLPSVEPLQSEFFRGDMAQSAATWNNLVHHVLMGERQRFFHKIRILSTTLDRLTLDYCETAEEIVEGTSIDPDASWKAIDSLHYDFNTCLREIEVVLKCFLRALPTSRLAAFSKQLEATPPMKRLRLLKPPAHRIA
ncbi:MAG: hypothetical protein ACRD5R_11945 [Candidatus Acidiferrales bacterium]